SGYGERFGDAHRIERLDDTFRTSTRQLSITNQNAETAGREIGTRGGGDVVNGRCKTNTVIGTLPLIAFQQEADRGGSVDVGKFVGFLAAIVHAEAREHAEVRTDFLFEVQS